MDKDTDLSMETSDGRWLSYDKLAQLRRIDKPSAMKLATRNNWRRRKANTGQMQVFVPIHWFERSQGRRDRYADMSAEMSADMSMFQAAIAAMAEAKDAEIGGLRAAFEAALSAKNGEIDTMRETVTAERDRADKAAAAMEIFRGRFDDLGGKLSDAQTELAAAQDQVEALTQAEADRRARGVLARLRAAWRGE